jgi:hypothetical protein
MVICLSHTGSLPQLQEAKSSSSLAVVSHQLLFETGTSLIIQIDLKSLRVSYQVLTNIASADMVYVPNVNCNVAWLILSYGYHFNVQESESSAKK